MSDFEKSVLKNFKEELKIIIFNSKNKNSKHVQNFILNFFLKQYYIVQDPKLKVIYPHVVYDDYVKFCLSISQEFDIKKEEAAIFGMQYFYFILEEYLENELNYFVDKKRVTISNSKTKNTIWAVESFNLEDLKNPNLDTSSERLEKINDSKLNNESLEEVDLDEGENDSDGEDNVNVENKQNLKIGKSKNKAPPKSKNRITEWQVNTIPRRIKEDLNNKLSTALYKTKKKELNKFLQNFFEEEKIAKSCTLIFSALKKLRDKNEYLYLEIFSILTNVKVDNLLVEPFEKKDDPQKILTIILIKKIGILIKNNKIDFCLFNQIEFLHYLAILNFFTFKQLFFLFNKKIYYLDFVIKIPQLLESLLSTNLDKDSVNAGVLQYFNETLGIKPKINNFQSQKIADFYLFIHKSLVPETQAPIKAYLNDLPNYSNVYVDFLKTSFLKKRCIQKATDLERAKDPQVFSSKTLILKDNILEALNYKISNIKFDNISTKFFRANSGQIRIRFQICQTLELVYLIHSILDVVISILKALNVHCENVLVNSVKINLIESLKVSTDSVLAPSIQEKDVYNTIVLLDTNTFIASNDTLKISILSICNVILNKLNLKISEVEIASSATNITKQKQIISNLQITDWSDKLEAKIETVGDIKKYTTLNGLEYLDVFISVPDIKNTTELCNSIVNYIENNSLSININKAYKKLNFIYDDTEFENADSE